MRNNISLVSEVFGRRKIQESEYVVHAGFDESLIKSGVGYLEQIHVFVSAEVDATSLLLSELGKLFSPFSSILFTEFSSYHLPVFKDDGSVWEFDELVYFTASKFSDGGSSAKHPLSIISLSQNSNLTGNPIDFSPSGSGSGEEEMNKKQSLDNGKKRDTEDEDEADKNNKDPSHDPEDPGNQDGFIAGKVEISFEIASDIYEDEQDASSNDLEIYPIQDKQIVSQILPTQNIRNTSDSQNLFQTLTMHGCLTIEVILLSSHIVALPN